MRLSFRQRIFLGLGGLGTLPLGTALLVLALEVRSTGSAVGPRAALEDVTASGRAMIVALDTTRLDDSTRAALRHHTETIARGTNMARRAETLSRFSAGVLGTVILGAGVVLLGLSLHLARRWSAHLSAPIDELIQWVGLIRQRTPLPATTDRSPVPEFDALRSALREMSDALERARRQEIEQQRLIAFREIARRVAHEVRGPLTSSRLALAQLSRSDPSATDQPGPEIGVLREELDRLENMAREFSEFGRLAEGPEAPVDLGELLDSVIPATVPEGVPVSRETTPHMMILGHYEPLRRAVQNLLRNAVEATDSRGIAVSAESLDDSDGATIRLDISDHGPGVPADDRRQVFEPYFTTKASGTGLGLAMVKQTVEAHGGTVVVQDNPGGGATFRMELPKQP